MPWHMVPSDKKGLVYVVDDKGKRYSEKPIPKWRAKKQMAALYASEPEKKAAPMKAEGDGMHPASHYLVVENAFKPTTWHLRVRGKDGKPDHTLMGAAWAALHGGYRGNKYEGPGKGQALADLKKLYATENMTPPGEKGFHVFKDANGAYRWVTISSSAFRDRDGEIVSVKALAEDVKRCDESKSYGPLRWFHIGSWEAPDGLENWQTWKAGPGVDLGVCDFNMLHGKMLIESGTFKDAVTGEAFAEAQDNLEVSIAFSHPKDEPKEKEYANIHRFERSLLPAGMASNLLTKTYVLKGETSMKTTEKLSALVAILRGKPELAKQILDDAENVQKAAEAAGLEFKDVEEMISASTESETEEVIQTPPVEEPEAKKPEEVTITEVIEIDAKAAPAAPAAEPEPDEIGDMTRQELANFVAEVVKQLTGKKEAEAELKQAGRDQVLNDALASLKTLNERFSSIEKSLEETRANLLDLTDARPVGIKQLQSLRPTERTDNVIKAAPTGPSMDPEFYKFALGGK